MSDACKEEQVRLMARTKELKAMTQALELSKAPYDAKQHALLRDHLHQHERDLADFRRRCAGEASARPTP